MVALRFLARRTHADLSDPGRGDRRRGGDRVPDAIDLAVAGLDRRSRAGQPGACGDPPARGGQRARARPGRQLGDRRAARAAAQVDRPVGGGDARGRRDAGRGGGLAGGDRAGLRGARPGQQVGGPARRGCRALPAHRAHGRQHDARPLRGRRHACADRHRAGQGSRGHGGRQDPRRHRRPARRATDDHRPVRHGQQGSQPALGVRHAQAGAVAARPAGRRVEHRPHGERHLRRARMSPPACRRRPT